MLGLIEFTVPSGLVHSNICYCDNNNNNDPNHNHIQEICILKYVEMVLMENIESNIQ